MASSQELLAPELCRCYHCGVESTNNLFKYFDNKKVDQPRFQCHNCDKFFTLGSHGRPQGKTYAKKRNEDPAELKSLSRQCCHCGTADNALFTYYNNKSLLQPRFKCLSCGKQFQMRLLGTGIERRLVHTSSHQRAAPRRRKQGIPEPLPNTCNNSEEGIYQPFDGSFTPVPFDSVTPLEPGARLLPEMTGEDVQYANFLETELAEEQTYEANFTSWTGIGDADPEPPPLSDEDARFLDLLEAEILAEESNEAPIDDAFFSTADVDNALPPTWTNADAELMGFTQANARDNIHEALDASEKIADTVFRSAFNNQFEVMYGTRALERSPDAAVCSNPEWTWTQNDDTSVESLYSMSYAEAAAACCRQMDLDMAAKNNSTQTAPTWTFQRRKAPSVFRPNECRLHRLCRAIRGYSLHRWRDYSTSQKIIGIVISCEYLALPLQSTSARSGATYDQHSQQTR